MNIFQNKRNHIEKLKEICLEKKVDYSLLNELLESVKIKRLKRVNYHQQKIADVIEKSIK